jgi:hypothetical protein
VVDAVEGGDAQATPYLGAIDRLFRIDAPARAVRRTKALTASDSGFQPLLTRLATWRAQFSIPIIHALFTRAAMELVTLPPKTPLATALGYLLGQRAALTRCVTTPHSSLDNNPVENAIRPLKAGREELVISSAIRRPARGSPISSRCSRIAGKPAWSRKRT